MMAATLSKVFYSNFFRRTHSDFNVSTVMLFRANADKRRPAKLGDKSQFRLTDISKFLVGLVQQSLILLAYIFSYTSNLFKAAKT